MEDGFDLPENEYINNLCMKNEHVECMIHYDQVKYTTSTLIDRFEFPHKECDRWSSKTVCAHHLHTND